MSNKDSIILTPVKANDNQSGSLISGNTLTLFAPKANQTNPAEYGTISYNDLDHALEEYTYDKDTIDAKDDDTLQSSKDYTEDYTYDKDTIDSKDTSVLNSAKSYTENYTYDKSTIDSKDATTLQSAKDYTYSKSQIDSKDGSTLQSAKDYTDALQTGIENGTVVANKATNVTITNNDSGNNANVNFSIGAGAYNKTINNVANATNASDYNVGGAIDTELKKIKNLALDRLNAISFDNKQQIIDWIAGTYVRKDGKTVNDLHVGQTIYDKDPLNPYDYWVSELPVTSIDDLEEFVTGEELDSEDISFDPSVNHNKLTSDNAQDAIDEVTDLLEEKCNIYELGQFTFSSSDWTLNSTSNLYEYVFTNQYLTSSTGQIIEFTPTADSSKYLNDNNIVIYNEVEMRQGSSGVEAVIKAQSRPNSNVVVNARLKTVATRLSGSGTIRANQISYTNTGTGLGSTDVQSAISEVNSKTNTNASSIGTLSNLTTSVKTNLVAAVNDLNTNKEIGTYLYSTGSVSLSSASDTIDVIMDNILYSNVDYDRIEVIMSTSGGSQGMQFCCFSEKYTNTTRVVYGIVSEYMVNDYSGSKRHAIPVLLDFTHDYDTEIQHAFIYACNFYGTTGAYPLFRSGTSATVKVYARRS